MNRSPLLIDTFCKSAAAILIFSGLAKIISEFSGVRLLEIEDPLIALSYREMFWIAGPIETLVGLFLFSSVSTWIKLVLVCFLSGNFLMYRCGLWLMKAGKTCTCLGTLTDWIPINHSIIEKLMFLTSIYLFAVGGLLAMVERRRMMARPAIYAK